MSGIFGRSWKWILGLGILITAAALLGLAAWQYRRFRLAGGARMEGPLPVAVAIAAPEDGAVLQAGMAVAVSTFATGPGPFTATQLWVDGALAGEESGPPGGISPLPGDFTWFADAPGPHLLVAQVLGSEGRLMISQPIMVLVKPSEGAAPGGEVGTAPVVLPQANPSAGSVPTPPSDAEAEEGTPWQPSVGVWVLHLLGSAAPQTPELTASSAKCGVDLAIHNLSGPDTGYRVFRADLGTPGGWAAIAEVAASGPKDWIAYHDAGAVGSLVYYVEAFNTAGEAPSNPVMVYVDPSPCPPPEVNLPVATLRLQDLRIEPAADQVYCYRSLGGIDWARVPEEGFFDLHPADASQVAAQWHLLLADLQGGKQDETVALYLQCWGWRGGALVELGDAVQDLDLTHGGRHTINAGALSAAVDVSLGGTGELRNPLGMFPMGGDGGMEISVDPSLLAGRLEYPVVETDEIPFITAWVSYDPEVCTAHLEPEAQNLFGSLLLCQPYPGYNIGPGGANPQPYLVWTLLDNTCAAGFGSDCVPYHWLVDYAEAEGLSFRWSFEIQSGVYPAPQQFPADVPPDRTVLTPDYHCSGSGLPMRVRTQLVSSDEQVALDGPWSNWSLLPCTEPIYDTVYIDVEFQTLHLYNLDDDDTDTTGCIGPGSCEDVEVYGTLNASPTNGQGIIFASPDYYAGFQGYADCTHPESIQWGGNLNTAGGLGCLPSMRDGSFNLTAIAMCPYEIAYPYYCIDPPGWSTGQNHILVKVHDGDAVHIAVSLQDEDKGSDDDPVCIQDIWTDTKSLMQWASTTDEVYHLTAHHEDFADCQVDVVLNAVTP